MLSSGTICVVAGNIESIAIAALLRTTFGMQTKVSASDAQSTLIGEDFNMDFSAKVMACSAEKIITDLGLIPTFSASVGFDIVKYLGDYRNTTLGVMRSKTLGELKIERIN